MFDAVRAKHEAMTVESYNNDLAHKERINQVNCVLTLSVTLSALYLTPSLLSSSLPRSLPFPSPISASRRRRRPPLTVVKSIAPTPSPPGQALDIKVGVAKKQATVIQRRRPPV